MGLFRAAHGWRRGQKTSLPLPTLPKELSHIYYNNETWHSCILQKKTSKKYINHVPHPLSSADISIVSPETAVSLLYKTKIQGQFKVFANILPRIQDFCTFSRFTKLSNITIIKFFSLMTDFHKVIHFHVYTKQDEFHTVILQC